MEASAFAVSWGTFVNRFYNGFQDFVMEIRAQSTVATESSNWGSVKDMFRN